MAVEVRIDEQPYADLGRLDPALLAECFGELAKVKLDPFHGDPLGDHPEVGDLTGCRKVYFDGRRRRIVYQLRPDEEKPKEAYVVCIGRRANLAVYYEAARRLGRTPGVDAPGS